jgi:3-hydroxy-9,10-secoandrosta-1,3,5(10)-triene-9,17-dione monooxygenase reductase component
LIADVVYLSALKETNLADVNIDPLALRKALGSFATGVTIVTTSHQGEKFGVTANSFSSVSLQPPLILWSLAKSSASLAAFANAAGFAVHILAQDQQDLSNRFATKGLAKFADLSFETSEGDVPLLPDCAARFECRTAFQYEGGDHIIFVGQVVDFVHEDKEPLLFHAGRYAATSRTQADEKLDVLEENLRSDDLTYLVAHAYFQLLNPVRTRAARAGLALADHYALSVLIVRGECSLKEINDLVNHLGLRVDMASLGEMQNRGLVLMNEEGSKDVVITLTNAGRALMIELIATAKAREADAQLHFGEGEARLLKQLLRRFAHGLEGLDDTTRISRHMDLMMAAARGDPEQ